MQQSSSTAVKQSNRAAVQQRSSASEQQCNSTILQQCILYATVPGSSNVVFSYYQHWLRNCTLWLRGNQVLVAQAEASFFLTETRSIRQLANVIMKESLRWQQLLQLSRNFHLLRKKFCKTFKTFLRRKKHSDNVWTFCDLAFPDDHFRSNKWLFYLTILS